MALAGCSAGRSAFNKGERLEREGKYDEALIRYHEASAENPDVGEYRMRFLAVSDKAANEHLKLGESYFDAKRYDDAFREFQTAVGINPSLDRAKQLSARALNLRNASLLFSEGQTFERERKLGEAVKSYRRALELDQNNSEYQDALDRLQKSKKSKLDGYELNLKSAKPITLKFKDAKLKEAFNILSQLSGINFIFDEGVKDQNVTIFLENANFQQALDILTGMFKLSKKALNESTVIVYPKTPDKNKQYEELYVKTFYLNKLDAKKAVNLIRTMLQVKKIYVNEELNALVIRDNPDLIEVAGKILEANDVPDAEVLLEVEVMELSKKNLQDFGLALSRYAIQANVLTPQGSFFTDSLTSSTTTSASTTSGSSNSTPAVTAANLFNLFRTGGYNGYITVPNATFNFGKSLSNGETLSNPKLRVKNREKAKFNVGTRVPITTTSSNGTVGGVNVNVQYVDVGVKVNAEPTIHLNNEVNIKLSLEVSSILSIAKLGSDGNTQVATIGTRNLDTVLSLKDGETTIIGGLLQNIKTDSTQRVMLLGDIPVLGTLFSNNSKNGDKSELLLSITPRIIRGVSLPEGDVAAFWTGLEDDPSVLRPFNSFAADDTKELTPVNQPVSAAMPAVNPPSAPPAAVTLPTLPVPALTPPPALTPTLPPAPTQSVAGGHGAGGGVSSVTTVPVAVPVPSVPPTATGTAPVTPEENQQVENRVILRFVAPKSVKVDDQFTADVQVSDAREMMSAPFTLMYDPLFLEFLSASEGDFLKKGGKQTLFRVTNDATTGRVTVGLTQVGDSPGVSGAGKLLSAVFRAKKGGPASIGFMGVNFRASGGKPLDVIPYNSVVEVK
jgi:general secretion pathway protein D